MAILSVVPSVKHQNRSLAFDNSQMDCSEVQVQLQATNLGITQFCEELINCLYHVSFK